MLRFIHKIILFLTLSAATLFGQGAAILPWFNQQFTNSAGQPLANGRVYSCVAGSSCPGNPQVTYNSSNGFTQNTNPVILDASGRASIWLTPGLTYKFVVTDSGGTVQTTMDGITGAITQLPTSLTPVGPANAVQTSNGAGALFGSANLTWNPSTLVLGITGTPGQAGVQLYSGYFQSLGGYLSTYANGGAWNAFNSATDGAALRGYTTQQTTNNNAGGYFDFVPITYNPYNGATCTDSYGNQVQQPLPLNGLTNFGSTDAVLWAGTSPAMPSGGSCGTPLPTGITTGLNTNTFIWARGGFITDSSAYNAIQAPSGGILAKLGFTAGQAFYPGTQTTCTALNTPGMGYGGLGYEGDSNYCYWNATTNSWNVVNLAASGGGSGCTLGATADGQIIYNNSGACASSTNLLWNYSTKVLTVQGSSPTSVAIQASVGYVLANGGLNSGTCGGTSVGTALLNCVQTGAFGGITAGFGVFTPQAFYPGPNPASSPNSPGGGYGGLAYKSGSQYWYYNAGTSSWATVDFSTSGSGCTLGGTSTGQIIFNLTGACTSSGNLTWTNSSQQMGVVGTSNTVAAVQVTNGYVSSTGGFATTYNGYNSINAPGGGMSALSFTATNYVQLGSYNSGGTGTPPPLTTADAFHQGALAYDNFGSSGGVGGTLRVFDGANWNAVGGGGGAVAAPTNGIQYNNGATFAATSNFTWNNGTQAVTIGGVSGTAALILNGGAYIQANGTSAGFNAPNATSTNAIQAPSGGVTAKYLVASDSWFLSEEGAPSLSAGGQVRLYADASSHTLKYSENGNPYVTIATGGLSSLNGLTGAPSIVGTTNEINVSAAGSSITLSTPQAISTASSPTFANLTASSTVISQNTGTGITFENSNANFLVNGNGIVSALGFNMNSASNQIIVSANTAANSIQTVGGVNIGATGSSNGVYQVNGSTVINAAGQFIGASINTAGTATVGGAITANGGIVSTIYDISGGYFGQDKTGGLALALAGGGTCTLYFKGGILYFTSGC